jgi:hypothetical protein
MQHNWIVQVASFSNNENAEKVERILNDNDFITHRELTSNGYIRILLKDISNSEIEVVEGRLKDLGFPTILLRKP